MGQQLAVRGKRPLPISPRSPPNGTRTTPILLSEFQQRRSSEVRPAHICGSARSVSAIHRGLRGPKTASRRVPCAPRAEKLVKLTDIPTLAEQYRGAVAPEEISSGAHEPGPWVCRTWALSAATGQWHRVEHHFEAVVEDRSQQGHGWESAPVT